MTWCQGNRARLRIREREHSLTATPPATSRTPEEESVRLGTIYGFLAYGMWGILPIYFRSLEPASAWEILAHRIVWSFLFCIIIWTWRRDLSWLRPILRSPRRLALLSLAAFVLAINWGVFIWAVSVGNVVESSLGYFINPLFLVLMGVILLGERMNRYQWTAIGFGALAVAVISVDYGRLPYVALSLATSFSIYGLIKKRVGGHIGALESMTVESAVLAPFAAAAIIWIQLSGDGTFMTEGADHTALILVSGIATAVPLVLFGAAASRIPLTTMGLLQFIAPVGQFAVGVFVFGENVPGPRWAGFALVWVALVILTLDMFRRAHNGRVARRATGRVTA
jgi:chloramphenicol-sensitive protein RarD